ncbi:MAG: histidine kinase [Proteobacteria bacterium]|nr:histidine kinase [Pseudomonadota bacterium]
MSLRFKLLLLALSTLALPLAGWLIVRQMEELLRQGQEQTLIASAKALARSLAALKTVLPASGQAFYVHPCAAGMRVDGYADDWTPLLPYAQNIGPADDAQKARLLLCVDKDFLYLLALVRDTTRTRADALADDALRRDHLTLSLARDDDLRRYLLASAAPGVFSALVLDREESKNSHPWPHSSAEADNSLPETLSGVWQESADGYRVELRLPRGQMPDALTLNEFDADAPNNAHNELRPVLARSPDLSADLAQFAPEGMRVRVLSAEGWVIAESGRLAAAPLDTAPALRRWFENLIYRSLIAPGMTRAQDFATNLPRLSSPEIWQALSGVAATAWHPAPAANGIGQGGSVVLAAAVPLYEATSATRIGTTQAIARGEVRGALLLEQSGDALPLLTNRALLILIGASLGALVFAGAMLFAFAGVLGLRIRRLRDAVERAKRTSGKMERGSERPIPQPLIGAADELGDLARSFAHLLDETAAYTDYLRTLAAKLSHELQTPLAIVKSSLDNLDQQAVSTDARTYLSRARSGAERLGAIVRAMSEASRMERAIDGVDAEEFDLAAVVRGCADAYRGLLAPRRLEADLPSTPMRMHGAPELIAQALDKLIDNARSFTPDEGWIRITLHAQGDAAIVCVANQGPPLPPTMADKLFDSLVSVRSATAQKNTPLVGAATELPHLGLGLSIVRLIAELHRGRAFAANLPDGSGVEFSIELRGMSRRALAG